MSETMRHFLGALLTISLVLLASGKRQEAKAPAEERNGIEEQNELASVGAVPKVEKSFLPEDVIDPPIHEISPPVEMPKSPAFWFAGAGALAMLGLLGGRYCRHHWLAGDANDPRRIPHEVALRALEQLATEDLPQHGEIKRFYQRITDMYEV